MPTHVCTKDLNNEIRGRVHHERHLREILGRIHKATYHYNAPHAIQIIVTGGLECGNQVQRTKVRGTASVGYTELGADFTDNGVGSGLNRCDSSDLQERPDARIGYVVRHGERGGRKDQLQVTQTLGDSVSHPLTYARVSVLGLRVGERRTQISIKVLRVLDQDQQ